VRDCAAVGFVAPERTREASEETFGEVWRGGVDFAMIGSVFDLFMLTA
jgi:hypothetical protein